MPWTIADAPDLTGKRIVITGANSGLGLEATRHLVSKNASIVMACRNTQKGEEAAAGVRAQVPTASIDVMALDLSSLASIAAFSKALAAKYPVIDVLMNNAGVMALPFSKTADGFEMQIGTNHLGHFALTAQVLPLLEAASAPRIVSVSSNAHLIGKIKLDDLNSEKSYSKWPAYGQSKLANLLFIYELERWLRKHGKKSIAVAAHPGYSSTNLQTVGAKMEKSSVGEWFMKLGNSLLAQSAEMGSLPQVYAAVHPDVKGGQYFGPDGFMAQAGFPKLVESNAASHDEAVAAKLWALSEQLTKVSFQP
ncbi:MAG: SDR family oxidoreductase [Archangium sp.]|nr:SDR family oxidoreductase [Archangium sp.]